MVRCALIIVHANVRYLELLCLNFEGEDAAAAGGVVAALAVLDCEGHLKTW